MRPPTRQRRMACSSSKPWRWVRRSDGSPQLAREVRIASRRALAAARRVGQGDVELPGFPGIVGAVPAGHADIGKPQPVDDGPGRPQPVAHDVVGHHRGPVPGREGVLGHFIARSRAEIQDPVFRTGRRQQGRDHGTGLLDVEQPGVVGPMSPHPRGVRSEAEGRGMPGQRFRSQSVGGQDGPEFRRGNPTRVGPEKQGQGGHEGRLEVPGIFHHVAVAPDQVSGRFPRRRFRNGGLPVNRGHRRGPGS